MHFSGGKDIVIEKWYQFSFKIITIINNICSISESDLNKYSGLSNMISSIRAISLFVFVSKEFFFYKHGHINILFISTSFYIPSEYYPIWNSYSFLSNMNSNFSNRAIFMFLFVKKKKTSINTVISISTSYPFLLHPHLVFEDIKFTCSITVQKFTTLICRIS